MGFRKANKYNPPRESGVPPAKGGPSASVEKDARAARAAGRKGGTVVGVASKGRRSYAEFDIDGKPNRIGKSINAVADRLQDRVKKGELTASKIEDTSRAMDMDLGEYCRFQEIKTLAVMHGVLTEAEGTLVYSLLGNTVERFNRQPLEVKYALTKLWAELLGWAARGYPGLAEKLTEDFLQKAREAKPGDSWKVGGLPAD